MADKCKKGYQRINESCKSISAIEKYRDKNSGKIILGFLTGLLSLFFLFASINFKNNNMLYIVLSSVFACGLFLFRTGNFSGIPNKVKRIIYLLIFAIVVNLFVIIGYQALAWSSVVIIAMGIISIAYLYSRNYQYDDVTGIDHNYFTDSFIGIGFTTALVAFSSILPLVGAIGIPYLPESIADNLSRFAIICISTPIMEESFFRIVMNYLFKNTFKVPVLISIPLTAILFSVFHLTAYGGSYAGASGSFITAFIAGLIFAGLALYSKSNIANIFAHFGFNLFVFLPIIGIAGATPLIILLALTLVTGLMAFIVSQNNK